MTGVIRRSSCRLHNSCGSARGEGPMARTVKAKAAARGARRKRMTTLAVPIAVDLRKSRNAEAITVALEAFDALAAGEALVITAITVLPGLLAALQAQRRGLFEWSLLAAEPDRFQIQVDRRPARLGELRAVSEALSWDHDRLDAIEKLAFERLAAGDVEGARERWSEFMVGLRRHIRFEEELLFPAFEGRCGPGPTGVMRFEHREIEALIEAIGATLPNPPVARMFRDQLHEVLGRHNLKEEQVLYPATDRSLTPEERDQLIARIQAVR